MISVAATTSRMFSFVFIVPLLILFRSLSLVYQFTPLKAARIDFGGSRILTGQTPKVASHRALGGPGSQTRE